MTALEQVYERHLLGMARGACEADTRLFSCARLVHEPFTYTVKAVGGPLSGMTGLIQRASTLADALCALLRDLGVEPPARPSAEEVEEELARIVSPRSGPMSGDIARQQMWRALRALYARDPLLAESILAVGP